MPKEAHIKSVIEEYLNLDGSLVDLARAREEAVKNYHHLLTVHDAKHKSYDIHNATPVISAYDEINDLDEKASEARERHQELAKTIKGYIRALDGRPLDARFMFDELDHRAGVHTFYLENNELKTIHAPVS